MNYEEYAPMTNKQQGKICDGENPLTEISRSPQ